MNIGSGMNTVSSLYGQQKGNHMKTPASGEKTFLRIPMKQSLTRKPLRLYRKSVLENAALPKWGICLCSLVCSTVQIAEAK